MAKVRMYARVGVSTMAAARAATETGLPASRIPDCLGVNIHFTGA